MIGVQVDNQTVMRKLRGLAAGLRDTKQANQGLAADLYEFVMRNFQTEGGLTEAGAWEPLAPSTEDWKERHGYRMILQNTGTLRNSFMPFHDATLAGVGARALVGAADDRPPDIAEVHEFGLGHVPARPMLPTQAQANAIAMRVYGWFIESQARKAQ